MNMIIKPGFYSYFRVTIIEIVNDTKEFFSRQKGYDIQYYSKYTKDVEKFKNLPFSKRNDKRRNYRPQSKNRM